MRSCIFKVTKRYKMKNVTATGKIINFAKELFACRLPEWVATLTEGDLLATEREVYQAASRLFDEVVRLCLSASALQVCKSAKESQKNLVLRSHKIKLRTGHCVEVEGLYRKRSAARGDDRSRHLLESHWGVIEGAGPGLYDVATHAAMVAPSYDQAQCLLVRHGVDVSVSGVRRLTNRVADRCSNLGEANLLLESGESLAGKRVLISSDGGRSRTRDYRTRGDENTPARYDTPWKEPKLFVIEVLDERGRLCTHHLPSYGCRFTDEDHLALLEEYLTRLNIAEAEEVQLVADGATWIWNRVPDLLRRLGVARHRTTETLDYYHAVEHLHRLFDHLPRRIGKKHRSRLWKRCKQWLWSGKADHILPAVLTIGDLGSGSYL